MGEQQCAGCREAIPYYLCGSCHKSFPNPRFKSDVQCPNCNAYVYEEANKSSRHNVKAYVCQSCGGVVSNPKFTNYHGCQGCQPKRCSCGGLLVTNSLLDYFVCMDCNMKTAKTVE